MPRIVFISLLFGLVGCATPAPAPKVEVVEGPEVLVFANENLNAVLWTQTSAEWGALTQQTYTQADLALDGLLKNKKWSAATEQKGDFGKKPSAIIVDVDETVFDNAAFQARLVQDNSTFNEAAWNDWCEEAKAVAIPGALEFLQKAAAKGVTVFYVTNRGTEVEEFTRQNLTALGFPMTDKFDVVLTKQEKPEWSSDKTLRRQAVAETHRIVMIFGDNLGDFVGSGKGTIEDRNAVGATHNDKWGRGWYMLPNPMYGYWESSSFDYKYDLDHKAKQQEKASRLSPLR